MSGGHWKSGDGAMDGSTDYGTADGQVGSLRAGPGPGGEAEVGDVETLVWGGCYKDSWKGLIVPEAFAHPAKVARGLAVRLFGHGFERGWWRKGDLVADPFCGICGFGIIAAYKGLRFIGVELEPHFHSLCLENVALHRRRWEAGGDVPPVCLRGDSRRFAALVAGAVGVITSPPYADAQGSPSLGSVNKDGWGSDGRSITARRGLSGDYGTTPGQLGGLPQGDADSVITSPPYADTPVAPQVGDCGGTFRRTGTGGQANLAAPAGYGAAPGNVGNLPAGDAGAVVTSPPYEASLDRRDGDRHVESNRARFAEHGSKPPADSGLQRYGTAPGQVGALRQETYWDAVRCIYGQCLLALRPGGVACVVVKAFVRKGAVVDLPGQTWRLLLSLGFTPVERVRCLLSEETREPSLFGGVEVKKRNRQSFFRRLATKKGAPDIPFEEILVVRRPPGAGEGGVP
jgi:hypothetical protein